MRRLNQNEEFKAKNRVIQAPWHGRHRIYGERSSSGSSLRLLLVGSRVHEPLMRCCSSLEIGLGMGHLPAYCWLNSPLAPFGTEIVRFRSTLTVDTPVFRTASPQPRKNSAAKTGSSTPDGSAALGRLPATSPTTVTRAQSRYCSGKSLRLIITQ